MTFRLKTILGIAIIEAVLLLILVISSLELLRDTSERNAQDFEQATTLLFASAIKDALLSTDLATLESFVEEILKTPNVVYIRILDDKKITFAEGGDADLLAQQRTIDHSFANIDDGVYDVTANVTEGGQIYGSIELGISTVKTDNMLIEARNWTVSIAMLEIGLVAIFSFLLGTYLTRQLLVLKHAADTIAEAGPGHQIPISSHDEIADVTRAFNAMSQSLEETHVALDESRTIQHDVTEISFAYEAKNKAIIAASLDAIITIDSNGLVHEYNSIAEKTFGWTLEEIIGKELFEYIVPIYHRSSIRENIAIYLESGRSDYVGSRVKMDAVRKNGEVFNCEIGFSPIETHFESMFLVSIVDISDRLNAEKQLITAQKNAEVANETKSSFLATMSHEIRTPMNAILGILSLLRETKLTIHQQNLISTGKSSGELLLNIINDILDFSKMEANKLELESIPFNLASLINDTLKILQTQADQKNIKFEQDLSANFPAYVEGDPYRIRQILINLLNNAIKFSSDSKILVSSSIDNLHEGGYRFNCAVSDGGIGISPENQKLLFQEFSMVDQSYSRNHEGTGLGLAICKRLVSLMDGGISVNSTIGVGSTFMFNVKLAHSDKKDPTDSQRKESQSMFPDPETRILIAEDNPANQMVMRHMLANAGVANINIVNNGQEAVSAVESFAYDIVLMDISMPIMNGLLATQEIRNLPSLKSNVPIVALTAHTMSVDRERSLDAGMNDFLTKPIDRDALFACIAKWTGPSDDPSPDLSSSDTTDDEDNMPITAVETDVPCPVPAEDAATYIDEAVLVQLVADTSTEAAYELIKFFIEYTEIQIRKINIAIEERDMQVLEFEAHSLSSSAASHGGSKLQMVAREVERLCSIDIEAAIAEASSLAEIAQKSLALLQQYAENNLK